MMSQALSTEGSPYLSCEINGARFIVQTVPDSEAPAQEKHTAFTEERNSPNEDESVALVCLDGQVYAFRNGELHELDLTQFTDQTEEQEAEHQDVEAAQYVRETYVTEYVDEDNVLMENVNVVDPGRRERFRETEEEDGESREIIVEQNGINADDFVEVVVAFKCKICPYTTQDREQLLDHFQKVHVDPPAEGENGEDVFQNSEEVKLFYMCGECSNCFPTIEDCREHMIKDHQLTHRDADKDKKTTEKDYPEEPGLLVGHTGERAKSNGLKRQVRIPKALSSEYMLSKKAPTLEVPERNIRCTYRGCSYKFSTEATMHQHVACHAEAQGAQAFRCNICRDVKFPKWRPCSLHLWKNHQIDVDLLGCKICKAYKSFTMMKLLTHMRVHSERREFECSECGKRFKQASQLRNHRVMHLDRRSKEVPRWYTSKTCEICGKTYADSKCLKNHIQAVHSKLKPYVCNVCGHSSARKAMLQMHLRQHTGDKPYTCNLCEFRTGDHNSLRRHVMRHTGIRPYKCPHCSYSSIQSSSYKNHLRSKHPSLSGLFTCQLCPFKTVKKESYLQHVGDHEKGLIKAAMQKKDDESVEVFPGNIAAAQLIYSCLGAFSKDGKTIEANLMSSSTSADGTSQTITIQIPSKDLEGSLPTGENAVKKSSTIEQEDEETMHCFLAIPREEEENIDTGGITIPAEPEQVEAAEDTTMDVEN